MSTEENQDTVAAAADAPAAGEEADQPVQETTEESAGDAAEASTADAADATEAAAADGAEAADGTEAAAADTTEEVAADTTEAAASEAATTENADDGTAAAASADKPSETTEESTSSAADADEGTAADAGEGAAAEDDAKTDGDAEDKPADSGEKDAEEDDDAKTEEEGQKFFHEGFLFKKGGGRSFFGRRNWKKRYVVITADYCLSYYESATKTEVPLKGLVMPLAGFTIDTKEGEDCLFTIYPPEGVDTSGDQELREIQFKTSNADDKVAWVAAMQKAFEAAGPGPTAEEEDDE